MRVYILDDYFLNETTEYTGEELIILPAKISFSGLQQLKKNGIRYSRNSQEALNWALDVQNATDRDFGGIMVARRFGKNAIKFDYKEYNLAKIKKMKENESKENTGTTTDNSPKTFTSKHKVENINCTIQPQVNQNNEGRLSSESELDERI